MPHIIDMDKNRRTPADPLLADCDGSNDWEKSSERRSRSGDEESDLQLDSDSDEEQPLHPPQPTQQQEPARQAQSRLHQAVQWCMASRRRPSIRLVAIFSVILILSIIGTTLLRSAPPPSRKEDPKPSPRELLCTTWPVEDEAPPPTESDALKLSQHRALGQPSSVERDDNATTSKQQWERPEGLRIVGLLFYGRREDVDILDCYMQRNLVTNGGYLDEIIILSNTPDKQDVAWLDKLVASNDLYKKVDTPCKSGVGGFHRGGFSCLWEVVDERDTMYIKFDDDVVYMHEDAVPRLVEARLKYKDAYAIGGNIVNSYMAEDHLHSDVVIPYLPERDINVRIKPVKPSWRASQLPEYHGRFNVSKFDGMEPPFRGHRWLPVTAPERIVDTPIASTGSAHWLTWPVAAQQHYSLLENIEKDQVHKYWSGGEIWHPQYKRYNINFFAIWGSDMIDYYHLLSNDDERSISFEIPRALGRPFLVARQALVAHLHFHQQSWGICQTDLLDRYRAYANEMVCGRSNQKTPLFPKCPGF